MRALFKLTSLVLLTGLLAVGALLWWGLAASPVLTEGRSLSHEDIARARALLRQHDPRRLAPGSRRAIEIPQQDLDLAVQYLVNKTLGGRARTTMAEDRLRLEASVRIPRWPLRPYLNLDILLHSEDGQPRLGRVRLGSLAIPGALAGPIAAWWIERLYGRDMLQTATEALHAVRIRADALQLSYRWHPQLIEQARDTLLSEPDRAAMHAYLEQLSALQAQGLARSGSLGTALAPLFATALARSQHADPVVENRALLTVLATWAARRDPSRLVPGAPRPGAFRLRLAGRTDLAQHFLISAGLAVRGDSVLADAVGLYKEISDGQRGSGFSFTDLAADRAGTRFGERAVHSAEDAGAVQRRMAAAPPEEDFMPSIAGLPEHLDQRAFEQRFGDIDSAAYRALSDEIERRLDALALFRR